MIDKKNKPFIIGLSVVVLIFFCIALYGFYEKNRRVQLYTDFRANKPLLCGDTIVQKNRGWSIKNNRFFANDKAIKTIVFCERIDK